MNINRHNYESYFLLYVDGELSIQQQQEVELFVNENPDLRIEFNMLNETKLESPGFTFPDKTILFKHANNINQENYQEYFLLYIDNELSAAEKKDVELFVSEHPAIQQEFNALSATQLEKEVIIFEDKSILYKKE